MHTQQPQTHRTSSPLDALRAGPLPNAFKDALARGGVTTLKVPPAAGKSHYARDLIVENAKMSNDDGDVFVFPTHALMEEQYAEIVDELDGYEGYADTPIKSTSRNTKTCERFDAYLLHLAASPRLGKTFCDSCPLNPKNKGECQTPNKIREFYRAGKNVPKLITHAALVAEGFEEDRRYFIDESLESAVKTVVVDLDVFCGIATMTDEQRERLSELCDQLHTPSTRRPKELRGTGVASCELAALLNTATDPIEIKPFDEDKFERIREIIECGGDAKELLKRLPSENVWKALESFFDLEQFRGCALTSNGLEVTWVEEVKGIEKPSAILHLDASAHPAHSRALWGEDAQFIDLTEEIELGEEHRVVVVEEGITSQTQPTERKLKVHAAGVDLAQMYGYAPEDILRVEHKRHVEGGRSEESSDERGSTWMARIESDKAKGIAVEHHNGTRARGSNKYSDRSCVIATTYLTPKHAKDTRFDALLHRIELQYGRATADMREDIANAVVWMCDVAPSLQALHRIRMNQKQSSLVILYHKPSRDGVGVDLAWAGCSSGLLSSNIVRLSGDVVLFLSELQQGRVPEITPRVVRALFDEVCNFRGWCVPDIENSADLTQYILDSILCLKTDVPTSCAGLPYIYLGKPAQKMGTSKYKDFFVPLAQIHRSTHRPIVETSESKLEDQKTYRKVPLFGKRSATVFYTSNHTPDLHAIRKHLHAAHSNVEEVKPPTPRQDILSAVDSLPPLQDTSKTTVTKALAQLLDKSRSTVQRRIKDSGLAWSEILERVKVIEEDPPHVEESVDVKGAPYEEVIEDFATLLPSTVAVASPPCAVPESCGAPLWWLSGVREKVLEFAPQPHPYAHVLSQRWNPEDCEWNDDDVKMLVLDALKALPVERYAAWLSLRTWFNMRLWGLRATSDDNDVLTRCDELYGALVVLGWLSGDTALDAHTHAERYTRAALYQHELCGGLWKLPKGSNNPLLMCG